MRTVLSDEKKDLIVFKENLRRNSIITWAEEAMDVLKYKEFLKSFDVFCQFEVENGISKLKGTERYFSHNWVPMIKAGFSSTEIATVMKARVITFEDRYNTSELEEEDLRTLRGYVYRYNQIVNDKLNIHDEEQLKVVEDTAFLLYFVTSTGVRIGNISNDTCEVLFRVPVESTTVVKTMYSQDELELIKKVANSIYR